MREAAAAGIDGIVVDWERQGKWERQLGVDTEINRQTVGDLARVRGDNCAACPVICRVNPCNGAKRRRGRGSAVYGGADEILVPMVRVAGRGGADAPARGRSLRGGYPRRDGAGRRGVGRHSRDFRSRAPTLGSMTSPSTGAARRSSTRCWTARSSASGAAFDVPFGFGGLTLPDRGAPVPCRRLIAEMVRLDCSFSFLRRSFRRDVARNQVGAAMTHIREAIDAAQRRGHPRRSLRIVLRSWTRSNAFARRRSTATWWRLPGFGGARVLVTGAAGLIGTNLVQRLVPSRLGGRRGRPAACGRAAGWPGHQCADSRSARRARHGSRRPRLPADVHGLRGDADRPCPHGRTAASDARGRAGRDGLAPRPRRRDRGPEGSSRSAARSSTDRATGPCAKTTRSSRQRFEERSRRPPRCSASSVRAPATSPQSSSGRSRSTARRSATAGSFPTALRAALGGRVPGAHRGGLRPQLRLRRRRRRRDRRGTHGRRRAERSRDQSRYGDRDREQRAGAARRACHRPAGRSRNGSPFPPVRRTRTTGWPICPSLGPCSAGRPRNGFASGLDATARYLQEGVR